MKKLLALSAAALVIGAQSISADPTVITFDEEGRETGEIIATQYQELGVTISAKNNNKRHPDIATLYDTDLVFKGRDPDLQSPFNMGNAKNEHFGNALIIAENANDKNKDGLLDYPDDEAAGGVLTFSFDQKLSAFGFSLIDIDKQINDSEIYGYLVLKNIDDNNVLESKTIIFNQFAMDNADGEFNYYNAVFGNNSANNINDPLLDVVALNMSGFNRAEFHLKHSGAVDNITFMNVPEPGTSLLMVTGLITLLGSGMLRRKR